MSIPAVIHLIIYFALLTVAVYEAGAEEDFQPVIVATVISALHALLLWWGGFF